MQESSFYSDEKPLKDQKDNPTRQTRNTLMALADAIIPRTPLLAEEYGKIQFFGAPDLNTDEYIILSLNQYAHLANLAAELLNAAARQLVSENGNHRNLNFAVYPEGDAFAALAPEDRIRALNLLETLKIDFADLPVIFQENPELVLHITGRLNRFIVMGYYSEWSGYGATRMKPPDQRRLEYFPLSWKQAGYPGPSLGYRAIEITNIK
jgi:hypothetical protein